VQNESDNQACTKPRYEVKQADLPLSCPTRDLRVWDAHPRVYLPIEETGRAVCPYCGAEYILKVEANEL
jgi:uncharacterized Zn-finger protein